jgi:hypothetical protein
MNENLCAAEQLSNWKRGSRCVQRLVGRLRYWIFLNVWCRHLYRPTMHLLHRYNLHYAPPNSLNPRYGAQDHWCQWCGLRGTTWKYDPDGPLSPNDKLTDPAEAEQPKSGTQRPGSKDAENSSETRKPGSLE